MSEGFANSGWQLQSRVSEGGTLEISLVEVPTQAPQADQVVVRVEAAPVNPSDLSLLLAGADPSTLVATASGTLTAKLPAHELRGLAGRVGTGLPVGNEGAGVVVAAGANTRALLGKSVALLGGATYAEYRTVHSSLVTPLPEGTTPEQGAAWYINPMTALGMTETMRREGHVALVHTAAASNLGQMLVRLCRKDGIPLVNIVRRAGQVAQLRELGAKHVVDSSSPTFKQDLLEALTVTEATLAFDAIGGGKLAGQILSAMEAVAGRKLETYSRYGSSVYKQVYIYGMLDTEPTVIRRSFGFSWGVNGWLLPNFLKKAGPELERSMRERVVGELKSTFASSYTRKVSLRQALEPDTVRAFGQKATGSKYLIVPHAR